MSPVPTRGVTRWRRSAMLATPAVLAIAGMATAIVNGALAANLSVSNSPLTVTSSKDVVASGGLAAVMSNTQDKAGSAGSKTSVLEAAVKNAQMADVCATVNQSVLGLPFTLQVKAGDGTPGSLTVNQVLADATSLTGNATMADDGSGTAKTTVGDDASGFSTAAQGVTGAPGEFGLTSNGTKTTISNLNASAKYATIAGAVTLKGLSVKIVSGTSTTCS